MAKCADTCRLGAGILVVVLAVVMAAVDSPARRDFSDPLAVLSGEIRGSKRVPSEAEWATDLIEAFGLDEVLPPDADDAERFALLCPERAELVTEGAGRRVPGRSPLRVEVAAPPLKGPGEAVRMVVSVPSTALYRVSVEGVGMQRWVVDGRLLGHLDPSTLGITQAPSIVPLREGPHELAAYLAPQARIDRVELDALRSLCIAPADGWHAGRPLRYAVLARTLIHALGLEGELPAVGQGIPIEGEDFSEASAGGDRSELRLQNDPSARAWARAANGPAEFTYRVYLDEPGLFSVLARLPGGGSQLWSLDGRYRASLRPQGRPGVFAWNQVLTLPLASGEHVLRAFVSRRSGVDKIRLVPHEPSSADYVTVLARQGFAEGAPDAMVTRRVAAQSLSRSVARSDGRFLTQHATGGGRSPLLDAVSHRATGAPPAAPAPPSPSETR